MRRCNYRQFKSSWRHWQQELRRGGGLVGVVWGDCDYLMAKVRLKTKELFQDQGGFVVRLDGASLDKKTLGSLMIEPGLTEQPKLYIIESAQALDLRWFVTSAGMSPRGDRAKSAPRGGAAARPALVSFHGEIVHHWLFCVKTTTPRPPQAFFKILPSRHVQIVSCQLKPYQLEEFAADMATMLGLTLTPDADYLVRMSCGDQPYFLEQTLRKIAWIHPDVKQVDYQLIQRYLDLIPVSGVFKIYTYLATAQLRRAHQLLTDLLHEHKVHPVVILGGLHHYVKQIAALKSEQLAQGSARHQPPSAHAAAKVPSFLKKEYARALKGVTALQLARVLVMIAEADLHYKTHLNFAESHQMLHELVTEITCFSHEPAAPS